MSQILCDYNNGPLNKLSKSIHFVPTGISLFTVFFGEGTEYYVLRLYILYIYVGFYYRTTFLGLSVSLHYGDDFRIS